MPIKDRSLYPDEWAEISDEIRFARAGGMCEWCNAPHGQQIVRSRSQSLRWLLWDESFWGYSHFDGERFRAVRMSEIPEEYAYSPFVTVVLSVTHLDHTPANNADSNLVALCQRCHLVHNAPAVAKQAAATRAARRREHKAAEGQMEMFK